MRTDELVISIVVIYGHRGSSERTRLYGVSVYLSVSRSYYVYSPRVGARTRPCTNTYASTGTDDGHLRGERLIFPAVMKWTDTSAARQPYRTGESVVPGLNLWDFKVESILERVEQLLRIPEGFEYGRNKE